VKLALEPEQPATWALNLRLPGWCTDPKISLNGQPLTKTDFKQINGYACLERQWRQGDVVELLLPLPVQRIHANPKVEADLGRVALQRGPIIFCLEGADNGGQVRNLVIPPEATLTANYRPDVLGGVTVISGPALGLHQSDWPESIYLPASRTPGVTNVDFLAIPYFANANRQPSEMRVWMAETPLKAEPLPKPTIATASLPSASHCWTRDTLAALNDQMEPAASDDTKIPRFTWWDHRGTREWVQYEFDRPQAVSAVEVYWWDEHRLQAHCRVPQSWQLFFKDGAEWKPISNASDYGVKMDQYNRVTFPKINTTALRIEVQLQPEWSAGILEWRVE
jgi:hypothetical protein